jgi:hypothetical protein
MNSRKTSRIIPSLSCFLSRRPVLILKPMIPSEEGSRCVPLSHTIDFQLLQVIQLVVAKPQVPLDEHHHLVLRLGLP